MAGRTTFINRNCVRHSIAHVQHDSGCPPRRIAVVFLLEHDNSNDNNNNTQTYRLKIPWGYAWNAGTLNVSKNISAALTLHQQDLERERERHAPSTKNKGTNLFERGFSGGSVIKIGCCTAGFRGNRRRKTKRQTSSCATFSCSYVLCQTACNPSS